MDSEFQYLSDRGPSDSGPGPGPGPGQWWTTTHIKGGVF